MVQPCFPRKKSQVFRQSISIVYMFYCCHSWVVTHIDARIPQIFQVSLSHKPVLEKVASQRQEHVLSDS